MKNWKRVTALALTLALAAGLLAGCGSGASSSAPASTPSSTAASADTATAAPGDWTEPYSEPVTVSVGRGGGTIAWPEGEDIENNAFNKWIKDTMNIDVKSAYYLTDGNDLKQQITLSIASGELPDIMIINDPLQLQQLINADMIADLTDVYEEYASPLLRAMVDSYGGAEKAWSTAYSGDRLMAAAELNPGFQYAMTWIRQDWLDKLGLEAPKTLDDLYAVCEKFVEEDMAGNGQTIGMEVDKGGYLAGTYNSVGQLDPIFNNLGSYCNLWYDDGTGNYVNGSLTPETKNVLGKLAELYQKGVLAPDFATRDYQASIASGYCGVVFGAWWIPSWPLNQAVNNNPEAVWAPYLIRAEGDSDYQVYNQNRNTYWAVVRKDYEHPEVLIKLLNCSVEAQVSFDGKALSDEEIAAMDLKVPDEVLNHYFGMANIDWGAWPLNVTLRFEDQMLKIAQQQMKQVEDYQAGKTDSLTETELANIKSIVDYMEGTDTSARAQEYYMRYTALKLMLEENDSVKIKEVYYPITTKTMELKQANLIDLRTEAFFKIIMGNEPLDYFDTFVEQYNAQGGAEIAAEVNAQAKGE